MGTRGCLGEEGSFCMDLGDPNTVPESRRIGLLCGFGNYCVNNVCTPNLPTSEGISILKQSQNDRFLLFFILLKNVMCYLVK